MTLAQRERLRLLGLRHGPHYMVLGAPPAVTRKPGSVTPGTKAKK